MHNKSYFALLPLSFFISNVFAEDTQSVTLLDPIVVTGVTQTNPNSVKLNPKTTLQPLPAGDGAGVFEEGVFRPKFAAVEGDGDDVHFKHFRHARAAEFVAAFFAGR